ncbi:glycosyltransferase [Mycobacterium sp. Aquia_216]|uniref:glycosyltransferase n=1 Tax=Mycobacterium sp. Aquia_216 TaxID=2991729 RepID=UPI00227B91EB|nr:glycosyltransferase [Mycobacterium sp. Aquia_216]WAJ47153.1 glycosyltransferase [Mycobacterium sp. Aquia_216]
MPSALRVLIAAETYPPDVNGAARFAERLAGGLAGRGHDIHVVAPSPDGTPATTVQDADDSKVTLHHVRSRPYFRRPDFRMCTPWDAGRAAAALTAKIDPDVVHTQTAWMVGRYIVRAAVRSDIPLVATHHVVPENISAHVPIPQPLRPLAYRLLWKDLAHILRRADVVTAPTPRAVELLIGSTGLSDAIPVSNGVDLAHYQPDPGPGSGPNILYVGRMDREKRVDELIRAFAELPDDLPATLELIGDGPEREAWTVLTHDLGVVDRVRFHGFVPEHELVAAYARAAVFCMPGIAELQSLATLEAMASGKPVVAAEAMALPHLVRPGRNGWLYRPGDVHELSRHLATLLADPALRSRMGAASRELVSEHAIEATLDRFEGIYRDLIARGRVTRGVA